jgi:hypothetical protein
MAGAQWLLSSAIKRFQPIIASAKSRDDNESDEVIIVTRYVVGSVWLRQVFPNHF